MEHKVDMLEGENYFRPDNHSKSSIRGHCVEGPFLKSVLFSDV